MYITARLVQHFSRVETRDPRPWEECLGISCCSKHGVQVALIRDGEKTNLLKSARTSC
jgi:hypothetical protein